MAWNGKKGIAIFDKHKENVVTWRPIPSSNTSSLLIRTIKPDNRGNFWIGTMSGLFIVSEDGQQYSQHTNFTGDPGLLIDHEIRSLSVSREGTFWLGPHYGGVNYHNALSHQFGSLRLPDQQGRRAFKIGDPCCRLK